MSKTIVSVRIPQPMMVKLKQSAVDSDCLDLSEYVRSIVRKRYLRSRDPLAFELKALQSQLTKHLVRKGQQEQKEWLLRQLEQLKNEIGGNPHG